MKTLTFILGGFLLVSVTGCMNFGEKGSPAAQNDSLEQQKAELTADLRKAEDENQKLQDHLKVLTGLNSVAPLGKVYELQSVKITSYTNLYDKDGDGRKETLIVYLRPEDSDGDAIKAPGSADVQLWDLNKPPFQAMIAQWQVGPEEMRKLWFSTIIKANYRLSFNLGEKLDAISSPLTLKVKFTDYVTGKIFEEQKLLTP